MTVGEKIKKLRTDKMMTQSELVGDEITRNMLSRIESGYALPSIPTLEYLAKRLNVPVGYLLSDEKGDRQFEIMFLKHDLLRAYQNRDFRICIDICNKSDLLDDECILIAAESCLSLAIDRFNEGRLKNASSYFDEALMWEEKTSYYTSHIRSMAAAFFRYMRMVSRTLSSGVIDENAIEGYCSLNDDFCRYIYAIESIESQSTSFAETFVSQGSSNIPLALHIDVRLDMLKNEFRFAYNKLMKILNSNYQINRPFLYLVLCDLEICCRELGDSAGVYEYSNIKTELLQRMLSE